MELNAEHKESGAPTQKKKKKYYHFRISSTGLLFLVALIAVVVAFFVGVRYGSNREKKNRSLPATAQTTPAIDSLQSRWTSVGTIQEVSGTKLKVKDSRGDSKEAAITKDTAIVDRKGQKLSAKDLKKDQKVIVSGTKDEKDKNKLITTRIRIQQ